MNTATHKILQRDSLTETGFAGLREHQLVKNPQVFGSSVNSDGSWAGLGNFVYLADARFMPQSETQLHSHKEVDVISVMVLFQRRLIPHRLFDLILILLLSLIL